jgi:Neutral/alkaline non-lysosomal ceramidase, N-terminal
MALLAGVGRATITPPVGIWLMGYAARDKGSVSRHDDLVATALVLSDGEVRVALVTCDLIFLHPTTVARIRTLVHERTGIPAENVMICCSHTHSGPVPFAGEPSPADRDLRSSYVSNLVHLIVGAVDEANHGLQAAAWGVGRGRVAIGVNRREMLADGRLILGENPQGASDDELIVLRVDALDRTGTSSRPLAAVANYACHAVCLSSNSYAISADWPGVMRREAEAATGAMVGFIQGAGADINPAGGPQDEFGSAQRLGGMVAEELCRVYGQISLRREVRLRMARKELHLPLGWTEDDRHVSSWQAAFAEKVTAILQMPERDALAYMDHRFPWTAEIEEGGQEGVAGRRAWTVPSEVQGLRMSDPQHDGCDVALVGVAAEPFVEIGMEVKARSRAGTLLAPERTPVTGGVPVAEGLAAQGGPAAQAQRAVGHTMFAGYTNGSVGYLPTRDAYEKGGYEVDTSYLYYRLPAPLAPASAGMVIGEMLSQIEGMAE